MLSAVWHKFIENCIVCYKPGENITVDKQLFQTKTRCRFIQYIANKPDKLGIKFWLAVDVESKCIMNAIPFLGKDKAKPTTQRFCKCVAIKRVKSYLGKERNVTIDKLPHNFGKKDVTYLGS